jgi:hypothetical protein
MYYSFQFTAFTLMISVWVYAGAEVTPEPASAGERGGLMV